MKTFSGKDFLVATSTRCVPFTSSRAIVIAAALLATSQASVVQAAPIQAAPIQAAPIQGAPDAKIGLPAAKVSVPTAQGAINVLLVPLDGLFGASSDPSPLGNEVKTIAPAATSPVDEATRETGFAPPSENTSPSTAVGMAERAAAPLRRALVKLGFSDVLSASPSSSVLRRAVEEGRLPQRVVDDLQNAMRLVATATSSDVAAPDSVLPNATTSTVTTSNATTSTVTTSNATTSTVTTLNVPVPARADVTSTNAASSSTNATSSTRELGATSQNEATRSETSKSEASKSEASKSEASITLSTNVLRSAAISDTLSARRTAIDAASRIGRLLNYRAVVAFSVVSDESGQSRVVFLLVDSLRENGAVVVPVVAARSGRAFSLAAADAGSNLLQRQLGSWDAVTVNDKTRLATDGVTRARALFAAGESLAARDEINAVFALDPTRRDLDELRGDILLKGGDTTGAVASYLRVLESSETSSKNALWTKLAQAYVVAENWPETLKAGEQALALKSDSLEVRLAMAQAQIGRAQLFQAADRDESANLALDEADKHLKSATSFAPDDARVTRLQVQQLSLQSKTREALSLLDRVATQFPDDGALQATYATLLLSRVGREADAFRAWTRAWDILSKKGAAPTDANLNKLLPAPDRLRFRRLIEGFDVSMGEAAKTLYTLTNRVLEGETSREDAIVASRASMQHIISGGQVLKNMPVPEDRLRDNYLARLEAADKLTQAAAAYSLFLENGEESYHDRATDLHKEGVAKINAVRAAQ